MIERTINISGKDVLFRSSATVPRLYRAKFKRDIGLYHGFSCGSFHSEDYRRMAGSVRDVLNLPGASSDPGTVG